jgi:hypothetical protein
MISQFCWDPWLCEPYPREDGWAPLMTTDYVLNFGQENYNRFGNCAISSVNGVDTIYARASKLIGYSPPPEKLPIYGHRVEYNTFVSNLQQGPASFGPVPPKRLNVWKSPLAMLPVSDGTTYALAHGFGKYQVDLYWPAAFASGDLSAAQRGVAYSDRVRATGDPWPKFTLASGSLPDGLTMQIAGTIIGTPAPSATSSTFTVMMTHYLGAPVSKEQTIQVH